MSTVSIVTPSFKSHLINELIESFTDFNNNSYYAFVGNHINEQGDIQTINNNYNDLFSDVYQNMLFGKKLTEDDFRVMIRKNVWTQGTVYAMYDHTDRKLFEKNFFVVTEGVSGQTSHVWKCLDNNNDSPSMIAPVFGDTNQNKAYFDSDDHYYQTSDGYVWRYMFAIDSQTYLEFSNDDYIPYVADTHAQSLSVPGTIDIITFDRPRNDDDPKGPELPEGKNYNNYLINQKFSEDDILAGDNNVRYRLPVGANSEENFYTGTIIHLKSGQGAGEYRRILRSSSENPEVIGVGTQVGRVYIQLEDAFDQPPSGTPGAPSGETIFDIMPEVVVTGNGAEIEKCVAIAIIDPDASDSVKRVEILNTGEGYTYATATVTTPVNVLNDFVPASLRPIIAPPGGHASDPVNELNANALEILTRFVPSDNLPTHNSYSQFGIIADPMFDNVVLTTSEFNGTFVIGEKLYQGDRVRLHGLVATTNDSNVVTLATGQASEEVNYLHSIEPNDYILVEDPVLNRFQIGKVTQILTEGSFEVEDNFTIAGDGCILYRMKNVVHGDITNVTIAGSVYKIYLDNVTGRFYDGKMVVSSGTFATATVNAIDINSYFNDDISIYNFETFHQYTKCIGTISGVFVNDELVTQHDSAGNQTMSGRVYAQDVNQLYLTNINGFIDTALDIKGESGAVMSIGFDKYYGDIVPSSGKILYLQNDRSIERTVDQTEIIRTIMEF